MDGLATLAEATFASAQTFEEPGPSRFEACEIAAVQNQELSSPSETILEHRFIAASQLAEWHGDHSLKDATTRCLDQPILSTIKIFVVHRDVNVSLHICENRFMEVFKRMGATPHALYYVSCDYDGYHYWKEAGYRPTWFVGTSTYALLWTFDQERCHTSGVFIHRRRQAFTHFGQVLRAFARHAHVPQLLLFVIAVQQLHWYDSQTTRSELSLIRIIEQNTGFGPHPQGFMVHNWARSKLGHDIDKLTTWSQHVAELSGNFTNKMRHQRVASRMLRTVVNSHRGEEHPELLPPEGVQRDRYQATLKELGDAIPAVERHMAVYADYVHYLKDRVDRLSTVLFALLTHEDAAASIELAAGTRRDGSSMKTIAIMTMAFLPGTFFAAFFSMPTRQADAFWIYWVCAVPATLMVFVFWLGFSERRLFKSLQTRVDRIKEMAAPKTAAAREIFSRREAEESSGSDGNRFAGRGEESVNVAAK